MTPSCGGPSLSDTSRTGSAFPGLPALYGVIHKKDWAIPNATRYDENSSSAFASSSCAVANTPCTSMNAGVCFDRAAVWVCAQRPACGRPDFRASTASHIAHRCSHGWVTGRALTVRQHLPYGGLQRLTEAAAVPAAERPASRAHGQRRISYLT